MTLPHQKLLESILSQPSTSYREGHVISVILQAMQQAQIPCFQDSIGNIILGASSKTEYLRLIQNRTSEPLRIFMAHLDHPGFHGHHWLSPNRLEILWQGGAPTQHLEGAPVWLADSQGWAGEGTLTEITLNPSEKTIHKAIVEITKLNRHPAKANALYGGFRFRAPWWTEGDLLYTKGADDLVGSYAISALALELLSNRKKNKPPFLGILTRAEEVGFIGAIGHFELGWIQSAKRPLLFVSIETSRTLPGAEIGKGPVIRLGDKTSVFSPAPLHAFLGVAKKILPEAHQKRVMDGGTCEGTTALTYGLPTVGVSVPLGNYHNEGFEGGPDARGPRGPAPEFVHLKDLEGVLKLCEGLVKAKISLDNPWKAMRETFKKNFHKAQPLLRLGP